MSEQERPPIGTKATFTGASGTTHEVTVVPTGRKVPADEVNVMRHETGGIVTLHISQLVIEDGEPEA